MIATSAAPTSPSGLLVERALLVMLPLMVLDGDGVMDIMDVGVVVMLVRVDMPGCPGDGEMNLRVDG